MFDLVPAKPRDAARESLLAVALGVVVSACAAGSGQPTQAIASPTNATSAPMISAPPAAAAAVLGKADIGKELSAGTYRIGEPFAAPFTITLPDGMKLGSLVEGDVNISSDSDYVVIEIFENMFADPCHTESGPIDPPIARTVDGIVTGLGQMPGFDVGSISDIVVGRHAGKAFELTNTVDTSTSACSRGQMLPLWTYPEGGEAATNGGLLEQLWVVDVDGTAVIIARGGIGIDPVVASIDFE